MTTTTTTPTVRRTRGLAVLAAPLLAAVVWVLAVPVAGVSLVARPGGAQAPEMTITLGPVLVAGLVAAGLGWALLAVLERLTRHARLVWTIIAAVVLVGSLFSPVTAAEGAASVVLVALHLAVGAVLIVGLPAQSRREA